ncbi:MAG TPA: hypothetical protein VK871_12840 [Candidatus Limnocylindrales bacterium]|nr:hypothetical protein [Candidatus Limnocylindrales bacterium]
MTTIAEKKSEVGVIALFLVAVFALAAWRGMEGAPILAGAFALAAVGVLVAWLSWYRKPAPMLAISPEEIFYGRLDQPGIRIARNATGRLVFREGFKRSGWFLILVDEPDAPGISMIGFDMGEVRAACLAHGWSFGDAGSPAAGGA